MTPAVSAASLSLTHRGSSSPLTPSLSPADRRPPACSHRLPGAGRRRGLSRWRRPGISTWGRPEDRAVSADVSVPFCSPARLGRSSSDSLLPKPKPNISPPSRWIFLPVPSRRQRLCLLLRGLGVQVLPGNAADPRERCATARRLDSAHICVHSHTSRVFPGGGGGRGCAHLLTRVVFTGSAV